MRERRSDQRTTSSAIINTRATCGAAFVPAVSTWLVGRNKAIFDTTCPYYGIVRKGGVLPYLPVEITDTVVSCTPASYSTTRLTGSGSPCNVVNGDNFLPEGFFATDDNPILIDHAIITYVATEAVAEAKTSIHDLLTSMAEAPKTVTMIGNRMRGVFTYADKAATKALRAKVNSKSYKKDLFNRFNGYWLEYRYGWRPLIHEIQDAVEQLQQEKTVRAFGRSKVDQSLTRTLTQKTTVQQRSIFVGNGNITGNRTYRGFACATGRFNKLGDLKPLQTAWELIPYSFVVDWFFNIGGAIKALTPVPGVDLQCHGYSIKDDAVLQQTVHVNDNPADTINTTVGSAPMILREQYRRYTRNSVVSLLPRFYPRLSPVKLFDIVSLVSQRHGAIKKLLRI